METLHTEQYNGYTINIYHDYENEWQWNDIKNGDCGLIAFYGNSNFIGFTKLVEDYLNEQLAKFTGRQLLNRIKKYAPDAIDSIKDDADSYDCTTTEWLSERNNVSDLREYLDNGYESEYLDYLETIANITNTPCTSGCIRGYSQRDWQNYLILNPQDACTRDYLEAVYFTGFYSYEVQLNDELVDSCAGYLTGDESTEDAKNHINRHIKQERIKHQEHTKTMIKNHVPLLKR